MMILVLSGCGYSSMKNEMSAQVKKVVFNTPPLCNNFVTAHVSLGIMRGGVGSMSNEDHIVTSASLAEESKK